jgi:hypothetical protein
MPDDAYYAFNENATPPPGWKPKRSPRDRKSRLAKWWWLILVVALIFLGTAVRLLVVIFQD